MLGLERRGLNINVPIGLSVATATMATAKIQQTQIDAQVHQIELQVAVDVTNAATNVRSTGEAAQAAQTAQELAEQTYEGEQAKLKVGVSTIYNVILDLNALNAAKNSYLQAVLNYRNALVEMDRLQQTTLTALNVTLLSGASWAPGAAAVGNLAGSAVGRRATSRLTSLLSYSLPISLHGDGHRSGRPHRPRRFAAAASRVSS